MKCCILYKHVNFCNDIFMQKVYKICHIFFMIFTSNNFWKKLLYVISPPAVASPSGRKEIVNFTHWLTFPL